MYVCRNFKHTETNRKNKLLFSVHIKIKTNLYLKVCLLSQPNCMSADFPSLMFSPLQCYNLVALRENLNGNFILNSSKANKNLDIPTCPVNQ